MTDLHGESTRTGSSSPRPEIALRSLGDRAPRVDHPMEVLANRRRRVCLYYLHEAGAPLPIRDLAEAALTDRIREEAVDRFAENHLPELRALGLIRVHDEHVELTADPPLPVREWLVTTAAIELDATGTEGPSSGRPLEEPVRR